MNLAANLEAVEERIVRACQRSGRKREEITLMGVSKFQPIEAVEAAWRAGLRHFGESRVQEAAAKLSGFKELHAGAEIHLIGALQRNKAKAAASLFDCIQSVDREALAAELVKHTSAGSATGHSEPLRLLLEYRTGEETKTGFTGLDDLFRTVERIRACPSLRVMGMMTIAPDTHDEKILRRAFRRLVSVQRELERRFPAGSGQCEWSCLSMGMSGDFETAVEEGSTMLRIGAAIFGERM